MSNKVLTTLATLNLASAGDCPTGAKLDDFLSATCDCPSQYFQVIYSDVDSAAASANRQTNTLGILTGTCIGTALITAYLSPVFLGIADSSSPSQIYFKYSTTGYLKYSADWSNPNTALTALPSEMTASAASSDCRWYDFLTYASTGSNYIAAGSSVDGKTGCMYYGPSPLCTAPSDASAAALTQACTTPAGPRCFAGFGFDGSTCYECPNKSYLAGGTYSIGAARAYCTTCAAGYFQSGPSSTDISCSRCGSGLYSAAGVVVCTTCPTGFTTSGEGKVSLDDCNQCAAGYLGNPIQVPGCTPCSIGSYSDAGDQSCTSCPTGSSTTSLGSAGSYSCVLCAAGYGMGRTLACKICSIGSYSANGAVSCADCATGYSTNAVGQVSKAACTKCASGYSGSPTTGNSGCKPCAIGSYAAAGATSCTPCATGYTTEFTGSLSIKECVVASAKACAKTSALSLIAALALVLIQ
jgi:uncharacterized Zn finger protein (UPF0148 family)